MDCSAIDGPQSNEPIVASISGEPHCSSSPTNSRAPKAANSDHCWSARIAVHFHKPDGVNFEVQ